MPMADKETRDALAAKLAFLRASEVFDGVVEVIETHMSWVFLTRGTHSS